MTCCYLANGIGCESQAAFEIRDMSDSDPYACFTQSCASHIGEMLGHSEHVERPFDVWEVSGILNE